MTKVRSCSDSLTPSFLDNGLWKNIILIYLVSNWCVKGYLCISKSLTMLRLDLYFTYINLSSFYKKLLLQLYILSFLHPSNSFCESATLLTSLGIWSNDDSSCWILFFLTVYYCILIFFHFLIRLWQVIKRKYSCVFKLC